MFREIAAWDWKDDCLCGQQAAVNRSGREKEEKEQDMKVDQDPEQKSLVMVTFSVLQ